MYVGWESGFLLASLKDLGVFLPIVLMGSQVLQQGKALHVKRFDFLAHYVLMDHVLWNGSPSKQREGLEVETLDGRRIRKIQGGGTFLTSNPEYI